MCKVKYPRASFASILMIINMLHEDSKTQKVTAEEPESCIEEY